MKKILLVAVLLSVAFISCKKEKDKPEPKSQAAKEEELIKAYLTEKNISAKKDAASGLYYYIEAPGTGMRPSSLSRVTVNYKSEALTTGKEISSGTNVNFWLPDTITGWKIGLPLICKGGKIVLFAPSDLAFKNGYVGIVPANTVVIFYIELLDVTTPE
ncbi:MAG: peptidylprolyl isomerase [Sphingobacteriaceae bacterium]|nr:MAG: peptidylprolyl isomerase [Sphingobacteriaceae bacterium]